MIQTSALRIGNWVSPTEGAVSRYQIKKGEDLTYNYNPIPLTSEILVKAGFKTMDYEYDVIEWAREDTESKFGLTQSGIPVEQQPFTFDYEIGFSEGVSIEIKYVHELQNLYFALLGTELKIDL